MNASLYGAKLMRDLGAFDTAQVMDASEVDAPDLPVKNGGVLAVSQSGETKVGGPEQKMHLNLIWWRRWRLQETASPRRRRRGRQRVHASRARAATLTASTAGREDRQGRSEIYGSARKRVAVAGRRAALRVDREA